MSRDVVAITGAAGALGSTLATVLRKSGKRVALYDIDAAKDRLARLVETLGEDGAFAHAGDFSSASTWDAALAATKEKLGASPSLAALVAGGWDGGVAVHEAKDDTHYERMMRFNVDTVYRAMRALLPSMVADRRGSIVVIGSRAVERPWTSAQSAPYAASKSAVVALAQVIAQEVIDHGVRVNAILPSTLDTRANRSAMPNANPAKWVSLESASEVIAFLLSDGARDVTGAAIPVYGRA